MALLIHKELSDKVLGAGFAVHDAVGPGLLGAAYEGALSVQLKQLGLPPLQTFWTARIPSGSIPIQSATR